MILLVLLSWLAGAVAVALALTAHWKLDALRQELAVQRQSDLLAIAMRFEPDGPTLNEIDIRAQRRH